MKILPGTSAGEEEMLGMNQAKSRNMKVTI